MDFHSYGLRKELLKALAERGFSSPMEVQDRVLSSDWNNDLIVRAKTGSGKTLAFLLPLMQEMKIGEKTPKVLVLAPTRELAQQTAEESEYLGRFLRVSTASLVGGMDIYPQLRTLKHGAAIIAGTPGRVRDHIQRGTLVTDEISTVVLDEGDLMLDMGFRDELEYILNAIPTGRRWLFSATMPDEVRELAERYLVSPITLSVDDEDSQHEDILHRVYRIPSNKRFEGLVDVLLWEHPVRSLVFCHTKLESIEIAQRLQDHGFSAAALQGDMTQSERNAVLASFKSGSVPILVATNVAARGLDIEGVSHVIQLGLPDDKETFIHRSGRTGRAGHEGVNLILLSPPEIRRFKEMLKDTQIQTEYQKIPSIAEIRSAWRDSAEQDIFAAPIDADFSECVKWAEDLITRANPKIIIAKLLSVLSARNKGYSLDRELEREEERRNKRSRPPMRNARPEEERRNKTARPEERRSRNTRPKEERRGKNARPKGKFNENHKNSSTRKSGR